MNAPLSPLEFRLECVNGFSNAKYDFLKCLYDGHSVIERYSRLKIDLHVHFLAGERMWCANYRKRKSGIIDIAKRRVIGQCGRAAQLWEFPVLVFIRKVNERCRPIASLVRLEPLDRCDMSGIDALAPGILCPTSELIFSVYERKIREILRRAGIEFRDLKDQIFEGGSEIVANLADPNGEAQGNTNAERGNAAELLPAIGLEMSDSSLLLFERECNHPLPKVLKVFICPHDPIKSGLERMRKHGIIHV